MPLKLSLKPGEKFAINGAVIVNSDRRSTLVVQNKASILRERDIMQQEEVNSPARRIYFPIMMMYLDDAGHARYYDEFSARMSEFMEAVSTPEILKLCVEISKDVINGQFYAALRSCRQLIEFETELLGDEPASLSAHA